MKNMKIDENKMSKIFDEWFDGQDIDNWTNKKYMLQAYEAGAESRQKEVDKLHAEVEEMEFRLAEMKSRLNDTYTEGQTSMYITKQTKVDDLQKRIDEALNVLCMLQYSSAERIYRDVSKILKGETK